MSASSRSNLPLSLLYPVKYTYISVCESEDELFQLSYLLTNISVSLPDAVHTLTCALMLLNTDLHGHVSTEQSVCVCVLTCVLGREDPRGLLCAEEG